MSETDGAGLRQKIAAVMRKRGLPAEDVAKPPSGVEGLVARIRKRNTYTRERAISGPPERPQLGVSVSRWQAP